MFIWNKSSDTVWFKYLVKNINSRPKNTHFRQKNAHWRPKNNHFRPKKYLLDSNWNLDRILLDSKISFLTKNLMNVHSKTAIFRSKTGIFDKKNTVNRFLYPGLLSWISFSFEFSDARVCPAYKRVNKSIFQFKFINFLHLLYGDWPSGGRNSRMGMQGGSIWEEEDPQGTKKHNSITIRTMN